MFLRSEEPFVVSPALDKSEPARLPSGVGQGIHNILASCLFCNSTDNSLDALHPHLQLHVQHTVLLQQVVVVAADLLKHG